MGWLDALGAVLGSGTTDPAIATTLRQGLTGNSFTMPGGAQSSPMPVQMNPMSMGMGLLNPSDFSGGGISDGSDSNAEAMKLAGIGQGLLSKFGAGGSGSQQQSGASAPYRFGGGAGMAHALSSAGFMPASAITSPYGTGAAASLLQQIMQQANGQA